MKWLFTYDDESGNVTGGCQDAVITDADGNAAFVGKGTALEGMPPAVGKVFVDASAALAKRVAEIVVVPKPAPRKAPAKK